MTYYIFIENEKINGCGECQQLTENVQNIEVIETLYNDFAENPNKYIYENGEIVINPNYEQELAEERKKTFLQDFFEIPNVVNDKNGYYRKKPKGYSSAVESIIAAFNMVSVIGQLPKDTLIFYEEPDFTKPEECTEEWLIEHQFKNETMTPTEFGKFYAAFLQAWNKQEHEN